jgi:uncharacterized protein YkwD
MNKTLSCILAVAAWCLVMVPAPVAHALGDGSASLYGRTLLEQINNYRRVHGLSTLRFDANLIRLAENHSFAMFQQKRVSHRNFDERFTRSGSQFCVENVGWNSSTPLKQFDAWRHSSGHDENMLKEGLTKAGIAEIGKYVTFFACK